MKGKKDKIKAIEKLAGMFKWNRRVKCIDCGKSIHVDDLGGIDKKGCYHEHCIILKEINSPRVSEEALDMIVEKIRDSNDPYPGV